MGINRAVLDFSAGDRLAELARAGRKELTRDVDVLKIEEHPDNRDLRQDLVDSLAEEFRERGMVQYPAVRPHPDRQGWYQHIAGWHRIMAYRKNFQETGDERWASIPVIVLPDCGDELAHVLVWTTNLHGGLTREEEGHAFEVIARYQVPAVREADPAGTRGRKTSSIVAELASTPEHAKSQATVERALREYRRSKAEKEGRADVVPVAVAGGPSQFDEEALKAIARIQRDTEFVAGRATVGARIPVTLVRKCGSELRRIARVLEGGGDE